MPRMGRMEMQGANLLKGFDMESQYQISREDFPELSQDTKAEWDQAIEYIHHYALQLNVFGVWLEDENRNPYIWANIQNEVNYLQYLARNYNENKES